MFYSARPTHCNGKPEGNLARPSWAGQYRSLTDTTQDMGFPRMARKSESRKTFRWGRGDMAPGVNSVTGIP